MYNTLFSISVCTYNKPFPFSINATSLKSFVINTVAFIPILYRDSVFNLLTNEYEQENTNGPVDRLCL